MSASKARLAATVAELERELHKAHRQSIYLLRYVQDMQEEHDEIDWPPITERFGEHTWRQV